MALSENEIRRISTLPIQQSLAEVLNAINDLEALIERRFDSAVDDVQNSVSTAKDEVITEINNLR